MASFGDAPKEVLQRIFELGATQRWVRTKEETSDDEQAPRHGLLCRKRDPFIASPELKVIMTCAMVCRNWADCILDKAFWRKCILPHSAYELPEPWQMGRRWNDFFKDVPCRIECFELLLIHNIGAIGEALKRDRTKFIVMVPSVKMRQSNVHQAWSVLSRCLCDKSTGLTLFTCPVGSRGNEHEIGILDIMSQRWPHLESLRLDSLHGNPRNPDNGVWEKLANTRPEQLRADPPFPSLEDISFPAHPDDDLASMILDIAPNLRHCYIDTSGHRKDPDPERDMNRDCLTHWVFLKDEKRFRTFVTPFFLHAFKWPGPKKLEKTEFYWRHSMSRSHTPDYGVLISECRDGQLCELRMSVKDFVNVEDLTNLEIPPRRY